MERNIHLILVSAAIGLSGLVQGQQRYLEEVFEDADITINNDVTYGTNINFLTSDFSSPNVPAELGQLQGLVSTQQPIPQEFFDPSNTSTAVKVIDMKMDIYAPDGGVDTETARPVVIYLHTGNALPPPLNGSPNGTRKDSSAVEICKRMARRGYVAASVSYRGGWNPLGSTLEIRRGTLLNAIYRAIHDVRQATRFLKAEADGENMYGIDGDRIIVIGEGTGGYIALANATLDRPEELFIDKFVPDPDQPDQSYIDTLQVGDLNGFNGQLALYRPNNFDHETHFCVNLGGALADTSWMEPGDVPMVAFHTVFDPFAPFSEGTVIVPTTGEQVVDVHGSNVFIQLANEYGNNASFATLPDEDPYTQRARSLYGTTQVHGSTSVFIQENNEGLFPVVRPFWPAPAQEESAPWQWWDPNSPVAQAEVAPGITAHMAASASNPDMSATKGRAYIDTIMGYMNPRIVCALELGPCSLVGINENSALGAGVEIFPNPAQDLFTINSSLADMRRYVIFDQQGRIVRSGTVNAATAVIERGDLRAGSYFVELFFDEGSTTRKLIIQ